MVQQRFSVKFEIRLIDEQRSLRRCLRNLDEDISCDRCPGRIVWIRHCDEPGARVELSE